MKEFFFEFAPFVLLAVGAGIWLATFLFYDKIGLNMISISCSIGQLLLFLYCGIIIQGLHRQANMDSLTGICNRRCLFAKLPEILKVEFPVSLMMIDIDNFKRVNDTYGHSAGDEFLKRFAEILKSNTRSTDIVARLGGEEFGIFLPDTNLDSAYILAENLRETVKCTPFWYEGVEISQTISVGVTVCHRNTSSIDELLKVADDALYQAKEYGRNQTIKL